MNSTQKPSMFCKQSCNQEDHLNRVLKSISNSWSAAIFVRDNLDLPKRSSHKAKSNIDHFISFTHHVMCLHRPCKLPSGSPRGLMLSSCTALRGQSYLVLQIYHKITDRSIDRMGW